MTNPGFRVGTTNSSSSLRASGRIDDRVAPAPVQAPETEGHSTSQETGSDRGLLGGGHPQTSRARSDLSGGSGPIAPPAHPSASTLPSGDFGTTVRADLGKPQGDGAVTWNERQHGAPEPVASASSGAPREEAPGSIDPPSPSKVKPHQELPSGGEGKPDAARRATGEGAERPADQHTGPTASSAEGDTAEVIAARMATRNPDGLQEVVDQMNRFKEAVEERAGIPVHDPRLEVLEAALREARGVGNEGDQPPGLNQPDEGLSPSRPDTTDS